MEAIVLVIHLLLALGIIGVVLMQRSEGGALGIGGGGGGGSGLGGLVGGRAAGNFLTKATATLAGLFFVTSIVLSILAGGGSGTGSIVLDGAGNQVPAGAMGTHDGDAVPAPEPSGPSVPLDE